MSTKAPTDNVLRRKAARRGYKLTKLRQDSRWYNECGPFILADASTNGAVQTGLTADEVNEYLKRDTTKTAATSSAEAA
jgi:hypothetical protein